MPPVDGKKLRELRDRKVLSQVGLAERSGVDQRTIGSLERGDYGSARPSTIRKLAEALGVEPGELLAAGSE
jgi:transcriptional regulator with XRE-family HTH domain